MATYTKEEIVQYLKYIAYPGFIVDPPVVLPPPTYKTLATLQKYQQSQIPFENLDLHYRKEKRVVIGKDETFEKTVVKAMGRGGYCHELNTLYATVLRTLGFDLVTVGAKVSLGEAYSAWNHNALLVMIDGKTYLADTGFGSNCAIVPIAIDLHTIVPGIAPEEHRIIYQPLPGQKLPLHILQHRIDPQSEWVDQYAFSATTEFSELDYKMMSYATSTIAGTLFTAGIMIAKLVLNEAGEPIGRRTVINAEGVKERIGGVSQKLVGEFKTEQERIDALEKFLDIRLDEEERSGIEGDVAAVGAAPFTAPH